MISNLFDGGHRLLPEATICVHTIVLQLLLYNDTNTRFAIDFSKDEWLYSLLEHDSEMCIIIARVVLNYCILNDLFQKYNNFS